LAASNNKIIERKMRKVLKERKERWKSLMKQSLHQAAVKVLARDGLEGLTMDRVAGEAEIAKGTLYNYFKNKEDFLVYMERASFEPLDQEVDQILDSHQPPERKLEKFILTSLNYFDSNREFFRVFLDPELTGRRSNPEAKNRHLQLVEKIGLVFEEGIRAGSFRPMNPVKLGAMFVMACGAMLIRRLRTEGRDPVEEDARLIVEVFFEGIRAEGEQR
jgi:AcrR family transcriptional regulator